MELTEIKTDFDVRSLPTFTFITDRPMQPLVIKSTPDNISDQENKIFSYKEGDPRADDGKKRVRLTASSNATDLVGDVMSKNALQQMKDAAPGTTIFLNHDASVPDSVFGSVELAELNTREFTVIEDGKKLVLRLLCLEYDVVVEEANDKAVKTWNIINNGQTKLGASVTIAITDKSNLSGGRRQIDSVYYLETSIVGIPCNQTAWVNQVKSKSWVHKAKDLLRERGKQLNKQVIIEASNEAEPVNLDEISKEPLTTMPEAPVEATTKTTVPEIEKPVKTESTVKESPDSGQSIIMKLSTATSVSEAMVAVKDLFTEHVKDHMENPWLYTYLLEDAIMELIYCNSSMTPEIKLDAAKEMFDAFAAKMIEVLTAYWTEDDAEKSASIRKVFAVAASDHLHAAFKAGNRNNKDDQKTLDTMHNLCVELGANCDSEEKSADIQTLNDSVQVAEDSPEVKALVEAGETIQSLTAQKTALEANLARLQAEAKQSHFEKAQWKAAADTAIRMLEVYENQPAVRPGVSVS